MTTFTTFLGVSGFLSDGFQSNILLDTNNGKTLLLDCGTDIKHSLKASGRKVEEIDAVYISHLHGDHIGGLEWLGFYTYFVLQKKIVLILHESLFGNLWSILAPSMASHKDKDLILSDYFDIVTFGDQNPSFVFDGYSFRSIKSLHVDGRYQKMYSYSLIVDNTSTYGTEEGLFYISFDTEEIKVQDAKYIFYDCDVINLSGVHPNYKDLLKIPDKIRKKVWLYHYHDLGDDMPDAVSDGFAGFVKEGQIFEIG